MDSICSAVASIADSSALGKCQSVTTPTLSPLPRSTETNFRNVEPEPGGAMLLLPMSIRMMDRWSPGASPARAAGISVTGGHQQASVG